MRRFVLCLAVLMALFCSGVMLAEAAPILYGVTGDGASVPASLFTLNLTDGSATFVLSLGRGTDGETIGFNPTDGLLYHASGHFGSNIIFESILSDFSGTTNIDITSTALEDEEAQALIWDASRGEFLWKQDHGIGPLFSVTPTGTPTLIGNMDHQAKGLAFVGSTLYSIDVLNATLNTIDPTNASTLGSVVISLSGFSVLGGTGLATNPDTGDLYALLKVSVSGSRRLVTIDPSTGIATDIGSTGDKFAGIAFGAGTTVIPEPSTYLLFAVGILGIIGIGYRQRKKAA